MRKAITIAALALSICLLGGCDFFRQLAGRPTSREIAVKRALIEQEALDQQRRQDSVEAVQRHIADSLAREDSLRNAVSETLLQTRSLPASGKSQLAYRYYLMIGSFSSSSNAERQAAKAAQAGYPATLIPFPGGVTAVAICPSNSLSAVYASMKNLRGEAFFPEDAWILNNE